MYGSPNASNSFGAWVVYSGGALTSDGYVDSDLDDGVRPVITVSKSNLS